MFHSRYPIITSRLENPNSDETKGFVEKQGELTTTVLSTWCGETRDKLRRKLTQIFDYPKYGVPFKAGTGKYFYLHNTGLQPQGVLCCVNEDGLGDGEEGEVLVDPNEMSEDGSVALRMWSVSEDAKFLAYGLTSKGTDWVTIRVMAVDDKRTLEPDTLSWVKFSGLSWTKDCKRFFYS